MEDAEPDLDAALYVKYAPELVRFAAVLVGPSDAEDAVSAVFLRVLATSHWREVGEHRAYLYRAVLNECRQRGRASRRRLARELAVARPDHAEPDSARVELAAALADLSAPQRAVVYLTYWFGLTAAEAAATLGMSQRAVERHLGAARARLRRSLR